MMILRFDHWIFPILNWQHCSLTSVKIHYCGKVQLYISSAAWGFSWQSNPKLRWIRYTADDTIDFISLPKRKNNSNFTFDEISPHCDVIFCKLYLWGFGKPQTNLYKLRSKSLKQNGNVELPVVSYYCITCS